MLIEFQLILHLCNVDQAHQEGLESENILPLYISAMRQEKQNKVRWLISGSAPLVELLLIEKQHFPNQ